MDPAIWLVGLGIVALVALRRRRNGRPDASADLADLISGMFAASRDPGWPRGVQEEDTIRPWSRTGSLPSADAPAADPLAEVEDCPDPVPVEPVRPAA